MRGGVNFRYHAIFPTQSCMGVKLPVTQVCDPGSWLDVQCMHRHWCGY